ncbi:hypothetical protein DAPPUDRAFT_329691 [Daphnia pulex]|uniref:Uncharacterized protein n=1 Tax=Daphnia pulex TaxID=6669 RepID=E9HHC7_DAPPU|nr:hypothetical protein DAPPUDRAFT_329691 [Daphnia pulex]|eukprot:EFX68867.1 hypothetical protein DAPPUDRAFT_329691 [Daphnia pulex]
MGGPGSDKSASRCGSRGESRGWSRGGSQVRGRGRVTATTFQEQLLREEEEETHTMKLHQEVIESKETCAPMFCIVYREVALRFGILCEPVYCFENINMDHPLILRCQEFPEQYDGERFAYIDVCNGVSLIRLNHMRCLGPL